MHVLIVNESKSLRTSLVHVFFAISPKIVVVQAPNGRQGLKEMTTQAFDFIITDLEMEGGDGETFIKHIKSSRLLKKKPIIVYSSREFSDDGYDNVIFVNKAFTPVLELAKIIKELIFKGGLS